MSNTREKLSTAKTYSFNIKFLEKLRKLSAKTGISESQLLQRATIKVHPELNWEKKKVSGTKSQVSGTNKTKQKTSVNYAPAA